MAGFQSTGVSGGAATAVAGPTYTADGQLKFPADYREWVFLSSGVDMSYTRAAATAAHPVFDNVFVNPAAYKVFMKTGTWPNGSLFMLENRGSESNHSINTRGLTQGAEVTGMEVHVKDSSRLKGGWGFYGFGKGGVSAKMIERPAVCYSCHEQHGAVDTTFVQFYPTMMGVAKEKGTLSAEYLKDEAATAAQTPANLR